MNHIATCALLLTSLAAEGANDRLLDAIAYAESNRNHLAIGDKGAAVSAYQLHSGAWHDANLYRIDNGLSFLPRSRWKEPAVAKAIASAYCDLLHIRLKLAKVEPSPANIYAAYTCGFATFQSYRFHIDHLPKVKQAGINRMLQAYHSR